MEENEEVMTETIKDGDSILTSTKKLLGIDKEYIHFDTDIIIHINSVFMILNQMGIGPDEVFTIEDEKALWSDFTDNNKKLEGVKAYMYFKVRLMFDPPTSSLVTEAMKRNLEELEWRLMNHG